MADKVVVMISSTILDLPEHREEVKEACLQQQMFPDMMEHLPASASDAIAVSLKKVDDADIYVGIFAHRYGHVPNGHTISITEMEYRRAVERGIDRLIFLIHDQHQILIESVDFDHVEKLRALKELLLTENTVNFFRTPEDLRAHVLNSLSHYRYKRDKEKLEDSGRLTQFIQDHANVSDLIRAGLSEVGPADLANSSEESVIKADSGGDE
jgi:hypothetical protein